MIRTSKKKGIVQSISLIFVISLIAKGIAFAKTMIQAAYFGATISTDAFNMANGIVSNILYMLTTSIGVVFLPIYIQKRDNDKKGAVKVFATKIITAVLISSFFGVVILEIAAPKLIKIIAPMYCDDILNQTVMYFRILILGCVFAVVTALYQNLLNAEKIYILSNISSIVNSIILITVVVLSADKIGIWALVISIPLSFLCQFVVLYIKGRKYALISFKFGLRDESINILLAQALPVFIGQAAVEINQVIDRALLSSVGVGAVTSVSYSATLYQFASTVISLPLSTVMFTELSVFASQGDMAKIKDYLTKTYKLIVFLCIPILIEVLFYSRDIVTIIYGRGNFDANAIRQTSLGLAAYIFCLIPVIVKSVLTRTYYALNDSKGPMIIGVLEVILNIVLSFVLVGRFGILGVVGATSIASFTAMILMVICFNKKYVNILDKGWFAKYYNVIIAGIICTIIMTFWRNTFIVNLYINFLLKSIFVFSIYILILVLKKEKFSEYLRFDS